MDSVNYCYEERGFKEFFQLSTLSFVAWQQVKKDAVSIGSRAFAANEI
jgi:hypothetical protein